MKKIHNEIKIGLTIVIAMLIAIIGFRLMQDIPIFRPSLQLNTSFERVDGISAGSSVYMSGVKIGSVNRVRLEGPDSVLVVMNLSYTEGVPVGSKAFIESSDLIGGKRIRIQFSRETEMVEDGGYIEGVYERTGIEELEHFADEIRPGVTRSTESLAEVLEEVDQLLKDGGRENINQALVALNSSSQQVNTLLERRSEDLDQSIVSLRKFMANLDTLSHGRQTQLDEILINLETTSKELGLISEELGGVSTELNTMMQNINSGDGTVGRLIQDPSLYENLDSLAINLKNISRKMEEDPHHFLKHMRLIDIF
ncbi:MlaD family protein [Natronogracilivirga saccharolytica]|uniref:MCE family protein n=1 Tax=Natronogracilivirga saccharolytica TaxID=2812953 RepID=A0A8J7SA28_9BACT|nr:MlaD family protein [Natronogracilivirga saccharolytica]MBP3192821.1 MCE family protein [Natronogracilivirga saccharolytica]